MAERIWVPVIRKFDEEERTRCRVRTEIYRRHVVMRSGQLLADGDAAKQPCSTPHALAHQIRRVQDSFARSVRANLALLGTALPAAALSPISPAARRLVGQGCRRDGRDVALL